MLTCVQYLPDVIRARWEDRETLVGRAWRRDSGMVDLDDVQHAYDEALVRVLCDIPENLVDATIEVDFTAPDNIVYRFMEPDGRGHGASLLFTDDTEEATVILADIVQEDIFEALCSACWPECPWHDSAPTARLLDGQAFWFCGRSDAKVARIGEIAAGPRRRRRR
jgi:hypothetical protein